MPKTKINANIILILVIKMQRIIHKNEQIEITNGIKIKLDWILNWYIEKN
jgi:hypothetical protein